jgi:hypothetical protein
MKKITTIKFTKEDLSVLDKLSRINNNVFISPDKILIIDGELKSDGSANNRFNGGNRTAEYVFQTPFTFIDNLGICKLPSFISTIKSLYDDYTIDVYEKYLMIKDCNVSYKFWLTPPENNMIPTVSDVPMERAKNTTKPNCQFQIKSHQLQTIFDVQKNIGTFSLFVNLDEDNNIKFKVSETFEDNGCNTAQIIIPEDQIVSNNLPYIRSNHVKFDYLRSDFMISDDYNVTLSETGIFLQGVKCRTNYLISATYVAPKD